MIYVIGMREALANVRAVDSQYCNIHFIMRLLYGFCHSISLDQLLFQIEDQLHRTLLDQP